MINLNKTGRYFMDIDDKQGALHKKYLADPKCPVAESIQPKLMQFTTNQLSDRETAVQIAAFKKTIQYFDKKSSEHKK